MPGCHARDDPRLDLAYLFRWSLIQVKMSNNEGPIITHESFEAGCCGCLIVRDARAVQFWVMETWTAWQWDRPQDKRGVILRRPRSPFTVMDLGLKHLSAQAAYQVEIRTTYDKAPVRVMKGGELAHLQLRLADAPSSTLVFYRQLDRK